MSLSFSSVPFNGLLSYSSSPKFGAGPIKSRRLSFVITSKVRSNKDSSKPQGERRSSRQVWRRRKLTKKDEFMEAKLQRVPFLEEQVRKMYEGGGIMAGDIDRLMKSEENRFAFVNDIAAEAKSYVENNRDEYGTKKAILHVLTNRMNEAGFSRPEAYLEVDPYSPGPTYQKEFYT